MKKTIALTIFLSLVFSVSAFAATVVTAATHVGGQTVNATDPVGALIGKCSKGVRVGITYEATAYAMDTVHKSGSRYYGSAFDSTAIYTQAPAGDINAAFAVPTSSVSKTAFVSPWAAM